MAIKNNLMGAHFPPLQTNQLAGSGDQRLVATGNSAGTALLIGSHINSFGTVGASTGAILSSSFSAGDEVYVYNGGASTLTVYPPAGATVDNTTSVAVLTKKGVRLVFGTDTEVLSHGST